MGRKTFIVKELRQIECLHKISHLTTVTPCGQVWHRQISAAARWICASFIVNRVLTPQCLVKSFISDINECALQSHNCGQDECVNTLGSFRCNSKPRCPLGFNRDAQGNCIGMENPLPLNTSRYSCLRFIHFDLKFRESRLIGNHGRLLDARSLVAQGLNATQTGDQSNCC